MDDSIEIQCCPDLNPDPTGQLPCQHYVKKGFCTLPNYFRCLEFLVRNEPALSYSAVDAYAACHRRFYWAYVVGIEAIEKSWPLILGSHAAKILGWLHDKRIPSERAILSYQAYIKEIIRESMAPEDEETEWGNSDLWKMKAIFDTYIEKEYHLLKGIPEVRFQWNFPDLPRVKGFIDLCEDPDLGGVINAWEFKYTGNPDNFAKFPIGDQLTTYFLAEPKIQKMTNRCLCIPGMWKKKETKKQKSETMLDFFERCKKEVSRNPKESFLDRTYYRNEFDLEGYKEKIKRVSMEIINYIKEGKGMEPFYQNKRACLHPFRCDFLRVCENNIHDPWALVDAYKPKGGKK
jgi:hypothetical protein